eukprot:COSAG05_NODE_267_length_12595_cov_7.076905_15_plen_135_part_00
MDIGNDFTAVTTHAQGAEPAGVDRFKEYEVAATKPWNMALDTAQLQFVPMSMPLPHQPFSPEHAAVHIKARGKQLPEWRMWGNSSASCPPMSPVTSQEPFADLVLLPYGSTNIRMAQLPTLALAAAVAAAVDEV